ncbi:uncharacterized protein BO96DRAFT_469387 [Aspergillus niger CBS 101883]|uniref:uncharacterized protein n=1 Tax=Aspergillus lacticoffeatus (strain CBS 101883) TaxID=1450533 RepID=UPI000D801ABA|nr:uncharacterized protein BO96DRAFT_469387 [Aspergillus niger CBS 101883]PYH52360.1 hypothetical protein BO96DRAFT_469387 [Aspergillus niger CBS 101883]
MSSFPQPVPVVACGRIPTMGKSISQHLLPEYQVIHFILSYEAAEAELPHLLAGRDPQSRSPNEIGTHDYSQPPRAVIFGRGYEPQQVEELKKKFAGVPKEPVAWVRGNPADLPAGAAGPDYAQNVAADMKKGRYQGYLTFRTIRTWVNLPRPRTRSLFRQIGKTLELYIHLKIDRKYIQFMFTLLHQSHANESDTVSSSNQDVALGEGETNRVGDHTTQLDAEAEAEMTAKMQHRKIQNRKNQRARRQRGSIRRRNRHVQLPCTHRLTPLTITVSDPKPTWALPRCEGDDEGEVTAGHKGLIVWGEPYDMQNWEATPGFLAKWSWAVDGCHDLVECSNRWRRMRGEEPIRLAESLEGSWPGRCRLAT